jgi:hypothetical protein
VDLSKSYENVEWIRVVQIISYEDGSEPLGSINEEELIVTFSNYGLLTIPRS